MAHITTPTAVVSGTKILASKWNSDLTGIINQVNASVQFLDVAGTNTVANSWTALQTYSAGITISAGNLSVAGTSTLTGNVTHGGTVGVTGATTLSSTLAVTGAVTLSSTLAVTGAITATGGVVGNVTGNLTGNVTGNVTGTSGSTTGNAATATALATARAINGVNFDGTAGITVTAAAGTLTGTTLNASVTLSSLTTLGTIAGNLIFTDNTYDIGASGASRPRTGYFATSVVTPLLNNSGSTITLRGVTYTLPSADGTSGQVLQTNGSAVLSWAAASSGFVTGSGTTGTIGKFTGSAAVGNSIITEASTVISIAGTLTLTGAVLTIGTTPATTGLFRIPKSSAIYARNSTNTANTALMLIDGSDRLYIGDNTLANLYLGVAQLQFPSSDGTAGQVMKTNGSGILGWVDNGGGGGISGLTTGKLPKAASSTSLTDSLVSETGSTVTVTGILSVSSNATVGGTFGVTGAATLSSTLAVTGTSTLTGNVSMGGTLTVTSLLTASGNLLVSGTCTVGGNTALNGNTAIGDNASDTLTITAQVGSDVVPSVDATYSLGTGAKGWLNLKITGALYVSSTQVVGARDAGWSTDWTGGPVASKSQSIPQFNAAPAALSDAARAVDVITLVKTVRSMYAALLAHGLIGA